MYLFFSAQAGKNSVFTGSKLKKNADNLNNVRREANRHFRKKKKEYLKNKIVELQINSKIKNFGDLYRGITVFNKGYQPAAYIVKMRKATWRNHFWQLLNVLNVHRNNVRQITIHTTEPLVPDPCAFEF